jgi:hypothetical protein
MPVYAARSFYDITFLKDYHAFFEPILSPSFERSFKQGEEIINIQSRWKQESFDKLKKFLNEYKSSK